MSVLERALGSFTGGRGTGAELPLDRPPWIRQPRMLAENRVGTPERAMEIGAVFSCIRLISQVTGSAPLVAYSETRTGTQRAPQTDLWNLVHDKSHPRIPAKRMWAVIAAHMAGWGGGYALKIREGGRRIVRLWPLYPGRVTVREDRGEVLYDYQTPEGKTVTLTSREVLAIPYFSLDGITGVSPIGLARRELGAIDAEATFREALLANGARLSGVLTTAGTLSDEAAKRVAKQWADAHQGANRAGSVAVLEGGMEWLQMSAAPKDLEFVAQRSASVADVARWFGVPSSIVNAVANKDSLTYSTAETEAMAFVKWCLLPGYFTPIETAINADEDLCPPGSGLSVKFLADSLLRADSKTRAEVYTMARNSETGWLTDEEVREAENLPPRSPASSPES